LFLTLLLKAISAQHRSEFAALAGNVDVLKYGQQDDIKISNENDKGFEVYI
jgi:hypothetical protein